MASGELVRDGRSQRLAQQPLRMLVELLAHPGEVVTRERMVEVLWPRGIVDFDNSLNAAVRKLRLALGDDSDAPRYIETLPRIGYRFVGKLDVAAPAPSAADMPPTPGDTRRGSLPLGGMVLGGLLLVGGLVWWMRAPEPTTVPRSGEAPASSEPRRTSNAKAYELYLRGTFHRSRRDANSTQPAIESFEAALREDPLFADAWSALAETYAGAAIGQFLPAAEAIANARTSALRAVELAADSAMAHTALGLVYAQFDHDYEAAEREYLRAREIDARYGRLWHHHALLRAYQGRLDEALDYIQRAREIEPTMLLYASNYGALLYYRREHEAAIAHVRTLLSTQPRLDQARYVLIRALVAQGDVKAALEQLPLLHFHDRVLSDAGLVYAHAGRRAEALQQVERLERHGRAGHGAGYEVAVIHAALGDVEKACEALRRAPDDHSQWINALRVDPRMDAMRTQPCYAQVEVRMFGGVAR